MASSISICFSPHALARPNNNNNNTRSSRKPIPKKLSQNPNHKLKTRNTTSRAFPPPPSPVSGGDATTYTRLPPKDDFFLSPFDDSLFQSSAEVKLSNSTFTKIPIQKRLNKKTETENDELSGEGEVFDGKLGFDYGKFELFEVNSESDYENEEDYDDIDDEVLGFRREGSENVFEREGAEEGEEEGKEKEKGVPAVMRCFDRAKIYVKAGDGGNGVVAFRREKFVPLGGPSGGDGGRGGNVYVEVDGSMNSLLPFRQGVHFRAGRGCHGQGRKQNGARGEDVVVKVPPGTVIREAGEDGVQGEVLLELLHAGQRALLLPGGRGGRGNASFKSGTNKAPKIAENGEEGLEM